MPIDRIENEHFSGGANLTEARDIPGSLASMIADLQVEANLGESSEDRVIYIDPDGDDERNDGTQGKPWATWDRALMELPRKLNHRLTFKQPAATFTSFPREVRCDVGPMGQLVLECSEAPTVVAGPFTITTSTAVNTASGWDLLVSGAGWTPEEYYGKFIRITSGAAAGRCWPIGRNTADTISIAWDVVNIAIANGDTFEILDPSGRIETYRAPIFAINGSGNSRQYSQFIMCNLEFVVDLSYGSEYDHHYPYKHIGDVGSLMGIVRFIGTDPEIGVFDQKAGLINQSPAQWDKIRGSGNLTDMEDEGLIMDPVGIYAHGSVQIMGSLTPPTGSKLWLSFTGDNGDEFGAMIGSVVCRNRIGSWSARSQLNRAYVGSIYADHNCDLAAYNTRVYGKNLVSYGARVDDRSFLDLVTVYFDDCESNAVLVDDVSDVQTYQVSGDTANIDGYGMQVGALCRVKIEVCDVTGALGAIRLTQTDSTVAYPAVKNTQTDGQGTYITA